MMKKGKKKIVSMRVSKLKMKNNDARKKSFLVAVSNAFKADSIAKEIKSKPRGSLITSPAY